MPLWKWTGVNKEKEFLSGEIDAHSSEEIRKILRQQGIRVKTLTPPSILQIDLGEIMVQKGLAKPFLIKELALFTRQLATMIEAGIPLITSLEMLGKSQKNISLRKILRSTAIDIKEGKTIADSLEKQKSFSPLYIGLVRAGESAGILDSILNRLASYLEQQELMSKKIKSALTYPAIVIVVGIAVIWVLMVFVVPMFVDMLVSSGQEVPGITQFIMDTSAFFKNNTLILFGGFLFFLIFYKVYANSPNGKKNIDVAILKIPLIGPLVIKSNLASFSRTLSALLSAGIPLIEALESTTKSLNNGKIAKDISNVKTIIASGKTLSKPLEALGYFPDIIVQMIKVGEQSGNLDKMLERVAIIFDEEIDDLVAHLTKMIEPFIIVVLGGTIAFVMVGMYLPVFMSAGGGVK